MLQTEEKIKVLTGMIATAAREARVLGPAMAYESVQSCYVFLHGGYLSLAQHCADLGRLEEVREYEARRQAAWEQYRTMYKLSEEELSRHETEILPRKLAELRVLKEETIGSWP